MPNLKIEATQEHLTEMVKTGSVLTILVEAFVKVLTDEEPTQEQMDRLSEDVDDIVNSEGYQMLSFIAEAMLENEGEDTVVNFLDEADDEEGEEDDE